MDFSEEFAQWLANIADVTAIIGQGEFSKIFHHIARQTVEFPLIVLEERGGSASEHLTGTTNMARGDYTLMHCGRTAKEATDLFTAVRRNLETFRGVMGSTFVQAALMEDSWRDRDIWTAPDGSQEHIYFAAANYQIWHNVPSLVP